MKTMTTEQRSIQISINSNSRYHMIETIKEFSEEEYENPEDIWNLAMKSEEELKEVLQNIHDYYGTEN